MLEPLIEKPAEGEIVSVSKLNNISKRLLEHHCSFVWVQGEISNLAKPASGHLYFTLKDLSAQVRCVFFRHQRQQVLISDQDLKNGTEILVRAKVTLYEERGDYQLLIYSLSLAGEGALKKEFEALRKKLTEEGLFSLPKKPLPPMPLVIGVVTSKTGAAVRDVVCVLQRRFPLAKVLIYPSSVQGVQALPSLLASLKLAIAHGQAEVLLLVRGGGSLEDLFAYNQEALVRLVAHCPIPIVSGVGHETDTTLIDYAADRRAPTPSAAAELVSPDQKALLQQCLLLQKRLTQAFWFHLQKSQQRLDILERSLQNPKDYIQRQQEKNRMLYTRLIQAFQHTLRYAEQQLKHVVQELDHLSPLATLARGYSIVKDAHDHLVTHVEQVTAGDKLTVLLQDGSVPVLVMQTKRLS